MAGCWEFIKYPKPSQILGHWLRQAQNAEGIIWRSNHYSHGENIFLFLNDDDEAQERLMVECINK